MIRILILMNILQELNSYKDTVLRVQEKQNKQKVYTEKCRGAKDVNCECGSFVRVRKPGVLRKGQSKFSVPLQVMEQRGSHTYKLSDGRIWNVSHLASACQRNARDDAELPLLLTSPHHQHKTYQNLCRSAGMPEFADLQSGLKIM